MPTWEGGGGDIYYPELGNYRETRRMLYPNLFLNSSGQPAQGPILAPFPNTDGQI